MRFNEILNRWRRSSQSTSKWRSTTSWSQQPKTNLRRFSQRLRFLKFCYWG